MEMPQKQTIRAAPDSGLLRKRPHPLRINYGGKQTKGSIPDNHPIAGLHDKTDNGLEMRTAQPIQTQLKGKR